MRRLHLRTYDRSLMAHAVAASERPRRVALVGHRVAGIETQFRGVVAALESMPEIEPAVVPVTAYRENDALERHFQFLSPATRGTLRSVTAASRLRGLRDLDAVWTQVDVSIAAWLAVPGRLRTVPVVYTLDSTPALLQSLGSHYAAVMAGSAAKRGLRDALVRRFYRRVTLFNPWSDWAAESLRNDYGIAPERMEVVPPGIDVELWRPPAPRDSDPDRRLRVLFVGGDFRRKGGHLLLDVWRTGLRETVELDLVTREPFGEMEAGVRVHNGIGANDSRLIELYRRADVFVLPTLADCYSMAALEALASGLPVIISPVGGIGEIFRHGREGLFVQPGDGRALGQAIASIADAPARRHAMGAAARNLAATRYDARSNTRRVFERLWERS